MTVVLLTFIGPWNEFLWPFLITKKQSLQPLAVALANYMSTVASTASNQASFQWDDSVAQSCSR